MSNVFPFRNTTSNSTGSGVHIGSTRAFLHRTPVSGYKPEQTLGTDSGAHLPLTGYHGTVHPRDSGKKPGNALTTSICHSNATFQQTPPAVQSRTSSKNILLKYSQGGEARRSRAGSLDSISRSSDSSITSYRSQEINSSPSGQRTSISIQPKQTFASVGKYQSSVYSADYPKYPSQDTKTDKMGECTSRLFCRDGKATYSAPTEQQMLGQSRQNGTSHLQDLRRIFFQSGGLDTTSTSSNEPSDGNPRVTVSKPSTSSQSFPLMSSAGSRNVDHRMLLPVKVTSSMTFHGSKSSVSPDSPASYNSGLRLELQENLGMGESDGNLYMKQPQQRLSLYEPQKSGVFDKLKVFQSDSHIDSSGTAISKSSPAISSTTKGYTSRPRSPNSEHMQRKNPQPCISNSVAEKAAYYENKDKGRSAVLWGTTTPVQNSMASSTSSLPQAVTAGSLQRERDVSKRQLGGSHQTIGTVANHELDMQVRSRSRDISPAPGKALLCIDYVGVVLL